MKGSPVRDVNAVLENLDEELEWQRELYRELHRHPELSLQEHATAQIVTDRLTAWGYTVQWVGGTGAMQSTPCLTFAQ